MMQKYKAVFASRKSGKAEHKVGPHPFSEYGSAFFFSEFLKIFYQLIYILLSVGVIPNIIVSVTMTHLEQCAGAGC